MANNSIRLRSLLKSPNSPRRNNSNVSFEDSIINTLETSPKWSDSSSFCGRNSHSHSFQVPPDSVSFLNGSSLEEITCHDLDDQLPKTDYTYARTATYRKKYLSKIRSVSPNMSRRRVGGGAPIFISDDESEDAYGEEFDNEAVIVNSRNFYASHDLQRGQDLLDVGDHSSDIIKSRRARSMGYTSTPINPHEPYHISAHDHYYKGMLLRSGSHVKGASRARGYRESSNSSEALSHDAALGLAPTYRSDYNDRESRARSRQGGFSNKTTTTTSTTYYEYEDENDEREKLMLDNADDSEMKLKYDEYQTEKEKNEVPYVLHNLDGLDVEDEFSDAEGFETAAVSKRSHGGIEASSRNQSNHSMFYTIITTIITTIVTTTTAAADTVVSNVLVPVGTILAKPVTIPASWMWRAIVSWCSWIIRKSATILLIEMESKHRRRRGCCLCFLPFLLLLPLTLLAGHYASHMRHHVSGFVSESESAISSMWLGLWSERESHVVVQPPSLPPPPVVAAMEGSSKQVDMTQINHYVQQTVLQMFSQHRQEIPPGLTVDQVRDIVQAMLVTQMGTMRTEMGSQIVSISGVLHEDFSNLRAKLHAMQKQIHESERATQTVAGSVDETKASILSMSSEQRTEWLAASQMLESKFLDLRNDVNELANQNSALVAMLKSCCQNNSALAATVRSHMVTMLSQMGSGDEDSALAGLMAWMRDNYVDRAELDRKLALVAADITGNIQSVLAERVAAEMKINQNTEIKTSIVSTSIDETIIKSIVEEALVQFSADRVGMPDFALESAGGSVLSVRCSETFYRKTALVSVFGVPLYYSSNSPRTVIQPNVHPGECWAFCGSSGYVVIQLSESIQPTSFTLEHIPRSLAPSGTIDSAPQSFTVLGLSSEGDTEGINMGNYTYLDNGKPIQHFPVQNQHPGVFQYMELRVLSNHGNPEYTCIYRFRVHGLP